LFLIAKSANPRGSVFRGFPQEHAAFRCGGVQPHPGNTGLRSSIVLPACHRLLYLFNMRIEYHCLLDTDKEALCEVGSMQVSRLFSDNQFFHNIMRAPRSTLTSTGDNCLGKTTHKIWYCRSIALKDDYSAAGIT